MFLKSYYDEDNTSNTNEAVKNQAVNQRCKFQEVGNRFKTVERNIESFKGAKSYSSLFIKMVPTTI